MRIFIICVFLFIQLKAGTHSFVIENDFLTGTDKHYTNGLFYTSMEDNAKAPWLLNISSMDKKSSSLTISQLMFTPDNISSSDRVLDDYPYAGHIGLTWSLFQYSNNFMHNMGFSLGSVGPISKAEQAQKEVHKLIGDTIPQGWGHQLGNAPTAGLIYQFAARTKLLKLFGLDFDWTTNLRFDYGNFYSGAVIGTVLRFGNHFPKNFPTTGSYFGGHESAMLNIKSTRGLKYSLSLGTYRNKVDNFYVIDEAKDHTVEPINYTVGSFASMNIYYRKFEFEVQFKSVLVNTFRITPETILENHGAFVFRWKWD